LRWMALVIGVFLVGSIVCSAQPSIEDYATIESMCDGVPVYSFNNITYIYGVSPDLLPGAVMQAGNTHPIRKIKPKKSWEIKHNLVGISHEMTPKTAWNDRQPFLPIHLIDGDPDTVWCSWGCLVPDGRPEWIRIDLPVEATIGSVSLVGSKNFPRKRSLGNYGRALPKAIEIKLSRNAWHWDQVFESKDFTGDATGSNVIQFDPRPARQIMITANNFPLLEAFSRYVFSIGEVEVHDTEGQNVALISQGAVVTVSSKSSSHENDKITQDALWAPLQYEIGSKWVRLGHDNGSLTWNYTEQEKGELVIDRSADEAITEVTRNGINVIFVLDCKGNWIYMDPTQRAGWPQDRYRDMNNIYDEWPPAAHTDPEMYVAYLRWVNLMVRHFKDRVAYFEIGNEWTAGPSQLSVEEYIKYYFEPIYMIIKKLAPDVPIMLGSTTETDKLLECLGSPWNIGPKLDGIGWHPVRKTPNKEYFDSVREFMNNCQDLDFKGEFFATEIYAGSFYPPGPGPEEENKKWWPYAPFFTEIGMAKYLTRNLVGHNGLGIEAAPCHAHYTGFGHAQSLVRPKVPAETVNPCRPTPTYYAWRTIATVTDDFYPAEFPVELTHNDRILSSTFEHGDKKTFLYAAWIDEETFNDERVQIQTDVTFPGMKARRAWGIDLFNGTEQELMIHQEENSCVLNDIWIKDYPTFIRLDI